MPTPGKYGRKPNDPSKPRLYLDDYFDAAEVAAKLPPFDPTAGAVVPSWPMYMNGPDTDLPAGVPAEGIGDCTCAYAGHAIQAVTARAGMEVTVTNQAVLTAYGAVGGYVPGNEDSDQGCQIQDVLAYMRTTGIALPAGGVQKILGFGALRTWTPAVLNAALQLFWTVDLGVSLPDSAETQFGEGLPWEYVPEAQPAGGHCIGLQSFKPGLDELEPTTWGTLWSMNKAFLRKYAEEAWVPVFPQVIDAAKASNALNLTALAADFKKLTGQEFPVS